MITHPISKIIKKIKKFALNSLSDCDLRLKPATILHQNKTQYED